MWYRPVKSIAFQKNYATSVGVEYMFPRCSFPWGWSRAVLFCSLAVLDPRVGHTMDVLSPFIPVLCHSDWLFHGESCPRLDVVHPGRAWPSSPSCTWHCSLHYLFLQAWCCPLFPHCVTIVLISCNKNLGQVVHTPRASVTKQCTRGAHLPFLGRKPVGG